MSWRGYLTKKKEPSSSDSQRVYCVLLGTVLWEYKNQKDFANGNAPLSEVEIVGASEWEGSRGKSYSIKPRKKTKNKLGIIPGKGFMYMTAHGRTWYATADTERGRDQYVEAARTALELELMKPEWLMASTPAKAKAEIAEDKGQAGGKGVIPNETAHAAAKSQVDSFSNYGNFAPEVKSNGTKEREAKANDLEWDFPDDNWKNGFQDPAPAKIASKGQSAVSGNPAWGFDTSSFPADWTLPAGPGAFGDPPAAADPFSLKGGDFHWPARAKSPTEALRIPLFNPSPADKTAFDMNIEAFPESELPVSACRTSFVGNNNPFPSPKDEDAKETAFGESFPHAFVPDAFLNGSGAESDPFQSKPLDCFGAPANNRQTSNISAFPLESSSFEDCQESPEEFTQATLKRSQSTEEIWGAIDATAEGSPFSEDPFQTSDAFNKASDKVESGGTCESESQKTDASLPGTDHGDNALEQTQRSSTGELPEIPLLKIPSKAFNKASDTLESGGTCEPESQKKDASLPGTDHGDNALEQTQRSGTGELPEIPLLKIPSKGPDIFDAQTTTCYTSYSDSDMDSPLEKSGLRRRALTEEALARCPSAGTPLNLTNLAQECSFQSNVSGQATPSSARSAGMPLNLTSLAHQYSFRSNVSGRATPTSARSAGSIDRKEMDLGLLMDPWSSSRNVPRPKYKTPKAILKSDEDDVDATLDNVSTKFTIDSSFESDVSFVAGLILDEVFSLAIEFCTQVGISDCGSHATHSNAALLSTSFQGGSNSDPIIQNVTEEVFELAMEKSITKQLERQEDISKSWKLSTACLDYIESLVDNIIFSAVEKCSFSDASVIGAKTNSFVPDQVFDLQSETETSGFQFQSNEFSSIEKHTQTVISSGLEKATKIQFDSILECAQQISDSIIPLSLENACQITDQRDRKHHGHLQAKELEVNVDPNASKNLSFGPCRCVKSPTAHEDDFEEFLDYEQEDDKEDSTQEEGETDSDLEDGSDDDSEDLSIASTSDDPVQEWESRALKPPQLSEAETCSASHQPFSNVNPRLNCPSCGAAFSSVHLGQEVPLTQFDLHEAVGVCANCYSAQLVLIHMRQRHRTIAVGLHDGLAPQGLDHRWMVKDGDRSHAVSAALEMKAQGMINEEEFQEVAMLDMQFRKQKEREELEDLRQKLTAAPVSSIFRLLISGSLVRNSQCPSIQITVPEFQLVCDHLKMVGLKDINTIDFYWPQIVHTYILHSSAADFEGLQRVEVLEDLILGYCQRSVHLATRFVWGLCAYLEKGTSSTHVAILRFLLEVAHNLEAPLLVPWSSTSQSNQEKAAVPHSPDHKRATGRKKKGWEPCWVQELFTVGKQYRLLHPAPCQALLLKNEFKALQRQRVELQRLGFVSLPSKTALLQEEHQGLLPCCAKRKQRSRLKYARCFRGQLRFTHDLVKLGETVAAVKRPKERLGHAKAHLCTARFTRTRGGFFPFGASESLCPVLSLPPGDAYVFNTNERAPLLLVLEIVERTGLGETTPVEVKSQPSSLQIRQKVDEFLSKASGQAAFFSDLEEISLDSSSERAPMDPSEVKVLMSATPHATATQSVKEAVNILRRKNGITSVPELPVDEEAVSEAVRYAQCLLAADAITEEEYKELVLKDKLFQENVRENSYLDVQFWLALSFGETWDKKRSRIRRESPYGERSGWNIRSVIVKTNADLRQEVFTLQLIGLCKRIFDEAGLDLWLSAYKIIPTSRTSGFVETLTNSISLDALKKHVSFVSLEQHFLDTYARHIKTIEPLDQARKAFVSSLAAYSIVCYIFQIKDRHNGNILLDTEGHLIHIDFGFLLGGAPGGAFSIETAPFKLTEEMVSVMGGVHSQSFSEFVVSFCCGFLLLQKEMDQIISLVEVTLQGSEFSFMAGRTRDEVLQSLIGRLKKNLTWVETIQFCLSLIKKSISNTNTKRYDEFQWISQGIKT